MKEIIDILKEKNLTLSTMESCTGGAVANAITNIEGSSLVFNFGAVTYSNDYKVKMGVDKELIKNYSVYSIEVAKDMSKKISDFTSSNYGIGVTGQINRQDPNNITNENNKIYISVYEKKEDKYITKVIEALNTNRENNKNYIIEIITKELKKLLLD